MTMNEDKHYDLREGIQNIMTEALQEQYKGLEKFIAFAIHRMGGTLKIDKREFDEFNYILHASDDTDGFGFTIRVENESHT